MFSAISLLNLKQLEQINIADSLPDQAVLGKIFNYLSNNIASYPTYTLEEKLQIHTFFMQLFG